MIKLLKRGDIMKKIIIGISPRFANDANYHYLKVNFDYIKQILSRNAIPFILLDGPLLEESLKMCDGFFIIGGDDIDPQYYHQTNKDNLSKNIDPLVDQIDKKILEYAKIHQIPTLGICRGIQAMAAFMNGSLFQDIDNAKLNHPSSDRKHYVTKVNSTKLTNLLPDTFLVNTYHHQAVDKVPDGFIVTYRNNDVIEAIEHTSLPFIGVQWHPERYYTETSKIIFDYFFNLVTDNFKN